MTEKLTFYTNPRSRGQIVRWMLEETGQPYETELLEYGSTMKAPDYLAINPMGKVPAIRHGDTVVTEGAAICAYLADVFPDVGLAPPLDQRGSYYRWMFFAAGPLEAAVINRAMGWETPEGKEVMLGYGDYNTTLDALEKAVSATDFVAGNSFTAADVYVGSHINWGMSFETIEKRPAFETYWSRLSDRPALQRANAISAAEQE
ncbi:MAG: glutathione S-transferase family protein [Stappiaceae bacterium]